MPNSIGFQPPMNHENTAASVEVRRRSILQEIALPFYTFIIRNVLFETHMGAYGFGQYLPARFQMRPGRASDCSASPPHRSGREDFPHPVPRCRTFPYGEDATCGSTPHHPSPSAVKGTIPRLSFHHDLFPILSQPCTIRGSGSLNVAISRWKVGQSSFLRPPRRLNQ